MVGQERLPTVLCVDADSAALGFLERVFTGAGYRTICASDGRAGLREFFAAEPNAAVIEAVLDGMNGFELCRRIREVSYIPIAVLTGLSAVEAKERAFGAGADDYLVKPVHGRELLARMGAYLRRASWPSPAGHSTYCDSYLRIDFARREVRVKGKLTQLTPIEFSLLAQFLKHPGDALSLDYLITNVWGPVYHTYDLIKWHVSNLRKKVEGIVTVRGYGYRYEEPGELAQDVRHKERQVAGLSA